MDSAPSELVSGLSPWLVAIGMLASAAAGAALALWVARRRRPLVKVVVDPPRGSAAELATLRDPVTGLMPRPRFETALDDAVLCADRIQGKLGVFYLGLDDFKFVNDAYGHAAGDQVLARAARCIRDQVPGLLGAARIAGDEFVLVVEGDREVLHERARALREALRQPLKVDGHELRTESSIGIALYPLHGARARLITHSAAAMRAVKQHGGAAHAEFEPSMGVDIRARAALRADLRRAIERNQLSLVYQPKIDARSLQITAAEALLRWHHPTRGAVLPGEFIPEAERHGLIGALGRWVIEEACRQAGAWRDRGLRMRVAVNISGAQLRQDDLVNHLEACLQRHQIAPSRFTCEITESVAMEDTRVARATFERLGALGVHVSIDDFGTGHSSLATLRRLPVAELKIDRAFVTDLETSDEAQLIAGTIVQMAHTLDLRVVAEGVETAQQRDLLVAMGCDELQGYLFARPMPPEELAEWAGKALQDTATLGFRESLFAQTLPIDL